MRFLLGVLAGLSVGLYTWRGQFTTQETTAQETTQSGIPVEVEQKIRAEAEEFWPDQYQLQLLHIQREREAYKELH